MMKGLASRTSMLKEIPEVEAEIKQIRRNPTYMKIAQNLKRLNGMGFGNPVMTIAREYRNIEIKNIIIFSH